MIRYNSLEVSEKLFCHEPGVLLNNRFLVTSQLHLYLLSYFCVVQMTGTAIHIA